MKKTTLKNIVLVGSSGAGRSSTGNTLLKSNVFETENFHGSCLNIMRSFVNEELGIKVFDMPPFEGKDTKIPIEKLFYSELSNSKIKSELPKGQIDAFLLIEKMTPRMNTYRADLESMIDNFGSASLANTIIIVIQVCGTTYSENEIYADMSEMIEINRILSEVKNEKFSPKWVVVWDNKNPSDLKINELLSKCENLPKYTYESYQKGLEENKERINKRVKEEAEKQARLLRLEQENEIAKMKHEIEAKKLEQAKEIEEKKKKLEEITMTENSYVSKIILEPMKIEEKPLETNPQLIKLSDTEYLSQISLAQICDKNKENKMEDMSLKLKLEMEEENKRSEEKINQMRIELEMTNKKRQEEFEALQRKTQEDILKNQKLLAELIEAKKNAPPQIVYVKEYPKQNPEPECKIF